MPEEPTTPKDDVESAPDTNNSPVISETESINQFEATAPIESPEAPVSTVATTPLENNPEVTSPKEPRKTGLIVGIIAAAALVILGAGGVLAYNVWYQNPQKVITDAIMNAVTAKTTVFTGTIAVDNDDVKVGVEITAKANEASADLSAKLNVTYQEKQYTVDASAVYAESGDIYVKAENLSDVKSLAKEQFAAYDTTGALNEAIDKIATKIDGIWIKISSKDLQTYSEEASAAQTCIADAINELKDDKEVTSEVSKLYEKNQFILVKKELGTKDDSIGYEIESDETKAKTFAEGLKDTKAYKTLQDCDESFTVDSDDLTAEASDLESTGTVQIWVDAWSHQFTKIDISGKSDGTQVNLSLLPIFNTPVTVDVPSTSTTLTQLQADITEIFTQAMGAEIE